MGPVTPTTHYDADDLGGVNEFASESDWQPSETPAPMVAVANAPASAPPPLAAVAALAQPKAVPYAVPNDDSTTAHPTVDRDDGTQFDSRPPDLALAEVVALTGPLAWQEAVAVIREYLLSASERSLPDPTTTILTQAGEMRPQADAVALAHPARAAAELLQKLLPSEAPPSLTALAAQEAGPAPRRRSPQELAQALAFFERPNRRADLAGLWSRAEAALARQRSERELTRLRHRVEVPVTTLDSQRVPRVIEGEWWPLWTWRDIWAQNYALGAMLCGILAVGSTAWLLVTLTDDRLVSQPLVSRALPRVVVSLAQPPLRAKLPPTARRALGEQAVGLPLADAGPPLKAVGGERDASPTPTPVPTTGHGDSTGGADAWIVTMRELVPESSPAPTSSLPRASATRTPTPAQIYSSTDADVTPARLRWPRMTLTVVDADQAGAAGVLRVTVDEQGRVERVRLMSAGSSFNDKMILAAAKAWVFRPAQLNDRPVKYQLDIRLP